MTIAQAFNEIAAAQGGTPNNSGTIAGAIDALNDTLAGSDQEAATTIEEAVRLLGQHISTGGGGGSSDLTEATATVTAAGDINYFPMTVCEDGDYPGMCCFTNISTGENTLKIVLYKNKYVIQFSPLSYTVSDLSGSIELVDAIGGFYEITGNCSFSVAERGFDDGGGGFPGL